MPDSLTAEASTVIEAKMEDVWEALVDPERIKEYMFGADVASDWSEGSPITWTGEWEGKPYEDKGTILRFEPISVLSYSHFSPLTGAPDSPENYHTVTIELKGEGGWTRVDLTQDNNATEDERDHSQQNWETMLDSLKKVAEAEKPQI